MTVWRMRFDWKNSIHVAIAAAAAFSAMWLLYTRVSWTVTMNSDNATALLQAQEIINGNYLLRGWTVGNISAYATEVPLYVIGIRLAGLTPALLRVVPAFLFAMLVTIAIGIVICETKGRVNGWAIAVTFALLALP
jgi:hypothetical protein